MLLASPDLWRFNGVRDKPGGVVLLREASLYLNAVHLVLKHAITQCHLQRRTHTHNRKKKRICMNFSVCMCVTTWCGMLLWLTSSRFSRWEWNKGQWTIEMPNLFSTMKPTVQSSGRRMVAEVCSNREPLKYTKTHRHILLLQIYTYAWYFHFNILIISPCWLW